MAETGMKGNAPLSRIRAGAAAVVVGLLIAGCAGPAASSPTAGSSSAAASSPTAGSSSVAASSPTAGSSSAGVTLPAPEVTAISFGDAGATTEHAGEIALADNLFAKYGLTVTDHHFTSDAAEGQALAAGQVDFIDTGGAGVVASQLTDVPQIAVREGTDNLVDDLYTGPNIKTANDLIGKSIAVSSFSSTTYGEALIAIKSLGLSASQVTIQAVGPDAARKAALVAGSVGGSMNGDSEKAQLAALGFKPLVVLATLGSGLPGQLLETTQAFASKNPNTVLAMVAAMNEGTLLFVTNTEAAIAAEVKIYNVPVAQATSDVAADQIGFQPIDGVNKPQDWTAGMALWEKTDSALASVDVTTAYTNKYSDQLKALGWYTSLKFPGY